MADFSEFMNKPTYDPTEEIISKVGEIADLVNRGFTVTIRPSKDGIKITKHKEKVI